MPVSNIDAVVQVMLVTAQFRLDAAIGFASAAARLEIRKMAGRANRSLAQQVRRAIEGLA